MYIAPPLAGLSEWKRGGEEEEADGVRGEGLLVVYGVWLIQALEEEKRRRDAAARGGW